MAKKVINRGKRSKALNKVIKLGENISKNLQSFLEIIPMQNIGFIKSYFLGSSISNYESDNRRITIDTKILFIGFIFPESET